MSALRWRTLVRERDHAFFVKGSELANAIVPGTSHRFMLCEVRAYPTGDYAEPDREYCVRDAHAITDAQVRDRVRPPIVARFGTEAEALAWCLKQP